MVCVLRYEDPGQISSMSFLETSPQDRNTATKLVTNTAIQLLSTREKEGENSSLYQEVQHFHVRCPNQSSCVFLNSHLVIIFPVKGTFNDMIAESQL